MSLPKHYTSTLSSSASSKHSLRGNPPTSSPRPRTIERRPSEQQLSDHTTTPEAPVHAERGSLPVDEYQEESGPRSGSEFKPFFTLVEDTESSEHYHPTVHYIFSDDDPEIITEAALRALETSNNGSPKRHEEQGFAKEVETGLSGAQKESFLPPPIPGVKERYIILDVEGTTQQQGQEQAQGPSSAPDSATQTTSVATGTASMSTSPARQQPQPQQTGHQSFRAISAHSLTPDWQVLNTQLSLAPTFDTLHNNANTADPSSSPPPPGALMLKIEGTPGFPRDIVLARGDDNRDRTLGEMMEQFEKRMGELSRVIEAGGDCPLARPLGDTRPPDEPDTIQEDGVVDSVRGKSEQQAESNPASDEAKPTETETTSS